jgi:hypothetical protein
LSWEMYYEKLALEVNASVAGLEVLKPSVVRGSSGVDHRFTVVAAEKERLYAFDLYQEVGQAEVLRTYIKEMDTGATTYIVCLSGRPNEEAKALSKSYGVEILGPKEVGDFFSKRLLYEIRLTEEVRSLQSEDSGALSL